MSTMRDLGNLSKNKILRSQSNKQATPKQVAQPIIPNDETFEKISLNKPVKINDYLLKPLVKFLGLHKLGLTLEATKIHLGYASLLLQVKASADDPSKDNDNLLIYQIRIGTPKYDSTEVNDLTTLEKNLSNKQEAFLTNKTIRTGIPFVITNFQLITFYDKIATELANNADSIKKDIIEVLNLYEKYNITYKTM